MTTTNPDTTDYGMFTEEGNVAVQEIVDNAKDKDHAMELLAALAASDPGNYGEATDTEVEDAVFYTVRDKLSGENIQKIADRFGLGDFWGDMKLMMVAELIALEGEKAELQRRLNEIERALGTKRNIIAEYQAVIDHNEKAK
tara:strand:+ start:201 stop:626 length:426 start_codon:yes stop_codon:yes gene_type:complete